MHCILINQNIFHINYLWYKTAFFKLLKFFKLNINICKDCMYNNNIILIKLDVEKSK